MYKVYNVKDGECIDTIAKDLFMEVDDIRTLNGLDFDYDVKLGDQLVVPAMRDPYFDVYTVMKGDSMYNIAKRYNITVDELALLNGLDKNDYIYPGQDILVPKANVKFYVTKNGDTLNTSADQFNISVSDLLSHNKVIYLLPDQLLVYKKEKR